MTVDAIKTIESSTPATVDALPLGQKSQYLYPTKAPSARVASNTQPFKAGDGIAEKNVLMLRLNAISAPEPIRTPPLPNCTYRSGYFGRCSLGSEASDAA